MEAKKDLSPTSIWQGKTIRLRGLNHQIGKPTLRGTMMMNKQEAYILYPFRHLKQVPNGLLKKPPQKNKRAIL